MRNSIFSLPEATLEVADAGRLFRQLSKVVITSVSALLFTGHAMAAAIVQLEGTTDHAKLEGQDAVRLSVIDWSSDEARQAVEDGISDILISGSDEAAFIDQLNELDTRGYIFTGEATGYSIKYAIERTDGDMSLLITPGLKSRNRYMWEPQAPEDAPAYTLIEVEWNGDVAELRSSLDGDIVLGDDGLELAEGEYPVFGQLEDATPYYLKESS